MSQQWVDPPPLPGIGQIGSQHGGAPRQGKPAFRIGNPLSSQKGSSPGCGWDGHRNHLAATPDGWQETVRLARHHQKQGIRWWLLQCFQDGVGSIFVHCLGWVDHNHPQAAAMRTDSKEFVQIANLLNGDLLTWLLLALLDLNFIAQGFGLQQPKIRVVALFEPVAGKALATLPPTFERLLTEQALGVSTGQFVFTDPFLADQQQGMRQAAAPPLKRFPNLIMKLYNIHNQILETTTSSCLRIVSIGRFESMTL